MNADKGFINIKEEDAELIDTDLVDVNMPSAAQSRHQYTVTLESDAFTEEAFLVYKKY